ncbi:hypothetical protein EJD97_003815 [Solanum chilense]|uniref:Uncharacterized protein n=1 Tax=Solanum chilense TaxID=4083 RepID=A0A6N2CIA0_SOLCI|nr:hypothetical protein EJD97_003815 [Solanum chilense]
MNTWKNCAEIVEVTTYGAIDGPSTPRQSIGGHRCVKEMLLKKGRGILTKCGATEALDGPSLPRRIVLLIHYH